MIIISFKNLQFVNKECKFKFLFKVLKIEFLDLMQKWGSKWIVLMLEFFKELLFVDF